jgi:DNA-3-methyladenine glycosylase II
MTLLGSADRWPDRAWSAAFVMLRGLGRMERIPIAEGKIPEDVSKLYGEAGN